MDGIGGLPSPETGKTELETAKTPNMDALAEKAVCGLLDPIGCGIAPGSGPAHFALFGYDPVKNNVGRGFLEAAGIDFPMDERDLFIRINFATVDKNGIVTDRRAGRISTETNVRICQKLQNGIRLGRTDTEIFFKPVKEHRALMVLRGYNLSDKINDTDPEATGKLPIDPEAAFPEAEETAALIRGIVKEAGRILSDEEKANMVLLRGFARYRRYPTFHERFLLNPLAIANYPMYRGISRLLGMTVHPVVNSIEEEFLALKENYEKHDFFFVHIKPTDSRGEDGNFNEKVRIIEEVDTFLPLLPKPDVMVITGDHSTPALLASHSWHPVPVILSADTVRTDGVKRFGERECVFGGLGRMPMVNLMGLALAHAGKLTKFGA